MAHRVCSTVSGEGSARRQPEVASAASGYDLPVVTRLLAHSSPAITQRSAHLADTVAQEAVAAVADIFGGSEPEPTVVRPPQFAGTRRGR
jgi:hypothetical protein